MNEPLEKSGGMKSPARKMTLGELAEELGASLLRGDPSRIVSDVATLENAGPESVCFIADDKAARKAADSKAGAIAAPAPFDSPEHPVLRIEGNPWIAVCKLIDLFRPVPPVAAGVSSSARIGANVELGEGAAVGANAIVGDGASIGAGTAIGDGAFIGADVRLGENCVIHPGVTILREVRIGDRVIIHPGTVIGADGYKYEYLDNRFMKIPQVGTVIIEDDVEIGANCCVDRAFLDATVIGAGTKIDNLVHIAHNVRVGRNCLLITQVGIAGSTVIGDGCILAGQVGVRDNVSIGDGAQIGAQSGIGQDVPAGARILGTPAIPIMEQIRIQASWRKLPEALKALRELGKRVEELEKKLEVRS